MLYQAYDVSLPLSFELSRLIVLFKCVIFFRNAVLSYCNGLLMISFSSAAKGLDSLCRSNCTCSHTYKPICTKDTDVMYYSPCHAGCVKEQTINSVSMFLVLFLYLYIVARVFFNKFLLWGGGK